MIARFGTFLSVILVLTLSFVIYVDSKKTQFKDCGSAEAKVAYVDITPCNTSPCQVVPGKNSSIALDFTATAVADKIKTKAYGTIAGVTVPYPLPQPNACEKSNITCPLKAGTEYVYTISLPLPQGLPKVDVTVELDMVASDGKKVVCIKFPVVVNPNGHLKQQMQP